MAALQLLLSSSKRSLVAGLCGLAAGVLYRCNFLGIAELKVRGVCVVFVWLMVFVRGGGVPGSVRVLKCQGRAVQGSPCAEHRLVAS